MGGSVGWIVASLKENGVWQNTVLMFTSDNGGLHNVTSTYPLFGSKAMPYEAGYRVPLIMTWPDRIPAGQTNGTLTMHIDLYHLPRTGIHEICDPLGSCGSGKLFFFLKFSSENDW